MYEQKKQKIKITLRSFDHKILDQATREIIMTARRSGADFSGPIPLPTNITKFTVNRSPHVDKKSREQFEIRAQKRLIIINSDSHVVESLIKIDLSPSVDVQVKLLDI